MGKNLRREVVGRRELFRIVDWGVFLAGGP